MATLDWDIVIDRGSDWEYDIYVVDHITDDPADLQPYSFEQRFYSRKGQPVIHTVTPDVDVPGGLLHLWVHGEITETWTWTRGYHEVWAISNVPALGSLRLLKGTIRIND